MGWIMTDVNCGANEISQDADGAIVTVPAGSTVTCLFSNLSALDFEVFKDFQPDNAGSVLVTLTCASGTATAPNNADEVTPAAFTVTGFSGDPLCTATESSIPAGYGSSSCQAALSVGSCTIINSQINATLTVFKDYTPNVGPAVSVSVVCTRYRRDIRTSTG
jgi:hypothetical protein